MSFFDKYEQVFGKKEEPAAAVNTDELRKIIREEIDAAFAGFEATTETKAKEEKKSIFHVIPQRDWDLQSRRSMIRTLTRLEPSNLPMKWKD